MSNRTLLSGRRLQYGAPRRAARRARAVQAHGVSACPKHYVANDSETDRFTVDVHVGDRALHELYLYPSSGPSRRAPGC
ncbi:hypothetical protein [Nocardia sp. NBC_00403]|uniref:hypothetical protein n=1 Tax=Nocardia sp. NBC_00403 TaxID=2975990 RepID=UPI002E1B59E3